MASDDNSGVRAAGPVVLRIKLRYDDVDAMVQRFAPNIGKSGLFLPTKSVQPVGTEVKFELRLTNDTPVLVGLGRVKHVRPVDPDRPKAAFGMAIELMRVSREGRDVIIRMLERRRAMGLPEVAIPIPEDLETARRAEFETQPRGDASAVSREAMLPVVPESAPLLTSARPGSGPIGIAREQGSARVPVPVLAPEKSRPRRPRVDELIHRAAELSSRVAMATPPPELDMQIDVDRVLSRARALAGGDLDIELATLREAAATPIEISIEAASAELARQLGGKPIAKRERSQRWEPPPPVELRGDIDRLPEFATKTRAETEASPSATIAAIVDTAVEARASQPAIDTEAQERLSGPTIETRGDSDLATPVDSYVSVPPVDGDEDDGFLANRSATSALDHDPVRDIKTDPAERSGLMIDDNADVASFQRALDPEDDDDSPGADLLASGEYHLDDGVGESTQVGDTPIIDDPPIGHGPNVYVPVMPAQLADELDHQLAQAEAEAAREIDGEFGSEEEVSDLDVLAEADEDDEDLMSAHGEADVSGGHVQAPPAYDPYTTPPAEGHVTPPADGPYVTPPPDDDFAARLDLGDDEEPPPSDDIDRDAAREFDAHVPHTPDTPQTPFSRDEVHATLEDLREPPATYEDLREPPAHYSYQRAKRASSEQSVDYTLAESMAPPSLSFAPHETGEEFDEPHQLPAAKPQKPGPDPRLLKHGRPTTQSTEDLEDALAALDVGGIDLERRMRRPTPSASRPLPGLPIERPRTGQVPVIQPPSQASQASGPIAVPERPPTNPRVAHTVPRSSLRNTGSQPIVQQPQHPTGPQMLAHDPDAVVRTKPATGQQAALPPKAPTGQVPMVGGRSKPPTGAKPPPIPAAARKPTQQVPLVKATQPAPVVVKPGPVVKRAPTDDGVIIDFDEDE